MESINLYDIYHSVYCRYRRAEEKSFETFQKAEEMRQLAKEFIDSPSYDKFAEFYFAEINYLESEDVKKTDVFYWKKFKEAFDSNNYYTRRPAVNRKQVGFEAENGIIYGCSSVDRPGQIKIGLVSKMDLYTRLRKSKNDHNLTHLKIEFAFHTSDAASIEDLVHEEISHKRVSGRTKDESVEWFYIGPIQAKKLVARTLEVNCTGIDRDKIDLKDINFRLNRL